MIQRFVVQPNEFAEGAAVHRAQHRRDPRRVRARQGRRSRASTTRRTSTTRGDRRTNQPTIENARLWDPTVILRNFQLIQEFQTFYQFADVDVDRYDDRRQDAPGADRAPASSNRRELPSQTWVNRHLVYTHGYGAVAVAGQRGERRRPARLPAERHPARRATSPLDQPERVLRREPRAATRSSTRKVRPSSTTRSEGTSDATTRYKGDGGVKLSSFAARAPRSRCASATSTSLISGPGHAEHAGPLPPRHPATGSRRPRRSCSSTPTRTRSIVDGKLVWVLDGYTTTEPVPVLAVDHPSGRGQRARHIVQLRAQLGEGHGRRVRRHDQVLRGRPEGPDHPGVPEGVPRAVHDDVADMPDAICGRTCATREDLFQAQTDQYRAVPHDRPDARSTTRPTCGRSRPTRAPATSTGAAHDRDGRRRRRRRRPQRQRRVDRRAHRPALPDDAAARARPSQEFVILRPFVPVSKGNRRRARVVHGRDVRRRASTASCVLHDARQARHRRRPGRRSTTRSNTDPISAASFSLLEPAGLAGGPAAACS